MPIPTTSTHVPAGTWSVDPARSRVGFRVKQFGLATVDGAFEEFEGTIELGDDPAAARAYGSVSVASLDTGQERRDAHLRSAAFFDAEQHPKIVFRSSEVRRRDDGTLDIAGDLMLRGVTRPITLTADVETADPRRLRLVARGRLNRHDHGVTPSALIDAVVSDEVELVLDISAERA